MAHEYGRHQKIVHARLKLLDYIVLTSLQMFMKCFTSFADDNELWGVQHQHYGPGVIS